MSGGAHGAAAQGDKRKREIDDVGEKGMDIDKITEVDAALGGGTDGDAVEGGGNTLGAMLSRMSRVDPEIEKWAMNVNEQNEGSKDWKQVFKKDG